MASNLHSYYYFRRMFKLGGRGLAGIPSDAGFVANGFDLQYAGDDGGGRICCCVLQIECWELDYVRSMW